MHKDLVGFQVFCMVIYYTVYWKSYKCPYYKVIFFSGFKGAKQILNRGPVCRLWPLHQNESQAHYGCQGNRWQNQAWWGTAKGITGDHIQEAVTCGIKVIPCCDCNCHNLPLFISVVIFSLLEALIK